MYFRNQFSMLCVLYKRGTVTFICDFLASCVISDEGVCFWFLPISLYLSRHANPYFCHSVIHSSFCYNLVTDHMYKSNKFTTIEFCAELSIEIRIYCIHCSGGSRISRRGGGSAPVRGGGMDP